MVKTKKIAAPSPVTLPWLSTNFKIAKTKVGRLLIQTDRKLWFIDNRGAKQGPYRAKLDASTGVLKSTKTHNAKTGFLTIRRQRYTSMKGSLAENGVGTGTLQSQLRADANWSSDGGR